MKEPKRARARRGALAILTLAAAALLATLLGFPRAVGASERTDPAARGTPDPIDLAVGPNGGVPRHPGATDLRSPFARPAPGPAATVAVAMLLLSVDDYDIKTGTFLADFFVSFTSDLPLDGLSLAFANGTLESKEVLADRPTFKLYRAKGTFKSPANVRSYPFDVQTLKLVLEDDVHGQDQMRFVVDRERTRLARDFRAVGWKAIALEARVLSQSYPDRFEGDDLYYSRYVFSVELERYATSAAFKVFVPAFVIVVISILGMWVPAEEMEVRSNSGAPMLAAAVLFHFSLTQEVPAASYLTRADKLMLGVYVSIALGMLSTWAMFVVKEEHMKRVFEIARVVVPLANVAVMAAACAL